MNFTNLHDFIENIFIAIEYSAYFFIPDDMNIT